jgi:hypothetical protein
VFRDGETTAQPDRHGPVSGDQLLRNHGAVKTDDLSLLGSSFLQHRGLEDAGREMVEVGHAGKRSVPRREFLDGGFNEVAQ